MSATKNSVSISATSFSELVFDCPSRDDPIFAPYEITSKKTCPWSNCIEKNLYKVRWSG